MYTIVSRYKNTTLLPKSEIFAVQGMENTYTFGGNTDTITIESQKVDFDNKFLGSINFKKGDLENKGYVLKQFTGTADLYASVSDDVLQVKSDDENAEVFKLIAVDTLAVGGAQSLGDTVYAVSYQLKERFGEKKVSSDAVESEKVLKMLETKPLTFQFVRHATEDKYYMSAVDKDGEHLLYVSSDITTGNMILARSHGFFNLEEVEAPEYATFETGHKRFTSDAKSLTMNTLNMFAELKVEGQDILKSTYEKDNFSLKLIKSEASTVDRPLYFITTVMANEVAKADAVQTRYYMVSGRDSALYMGEGTTTPRVHFIANDTIETMKESTKNPALWALKVEESGNYKLENQQEKTDETNTLYVGIVNNVVVMSNKGIEFSLADAPSPVANESIEAPTTIKVIGGNGEFQIRNAGGKKVTLSNILGQTIGSRFISSDNESVQTARGVVIVSVEGDKAYKVIVK